MDKVTNDVKVYTDVQSLEGLRYQSKVDPRKATKEVAQQFEAIMLQMVMRSMRDANKAFSSDLVDNEQMDFFQDLFDKQISTMTSSGLGFAEMIEKNLEQQGLIAGTSNNTPPVTSQAQAMPQRLETVAPHHLPVTTKLTQEAALPPESQTASPFSSPEAFVKILWQSAKTAAKTIGVDPKILLAQAALETHWGSKILPNKDNQSSYNLFNIKADATWKKQTTSIAALEQKNGVMQKEKASFRSYESFSDSFHDYVQFLKSNTRYNTALSKASNSQQFVESLQQAGFATDANYADKIMRIFSSPGFKAIVDKLV